jgi:uncharacterized membrane protein
MLNARRDRPVDRCTSVGCTPRGANACSPIEQEPAVTTTNTMPERPPWWQRCWDCILQFSLVLWIVRVPVVMTALGLLILGEAPQAQDLFVEFARPPVWRTFLFLFFLVFVWALPTHYAARLLLDTDARLQTLIAAQQALGWARCVETSQRWVPRVLGLLTFVGVLIAIRRSHLNLPVLTQKEVTDAVDAALWKLAVLVIVAAAGFFAYTIKRPRDANVLVLRPLKAINQRLAPFWQYISPGLRDPADPDMEASRDVGRFLLLFLFGIFLLIFWFGADVAARLAPRAMAVPFILGGWLPFLAYLAGMGRQLRAPLIVGLATLISLGAVVFGDNHSVRRVNANNAAGHAVDTTPKSLNDAVTLWMQENQCEPATCPRPIIIAAAGGASRAAFFAATIIGHFMQDAPAHGLDPNQVRKRLFAISGVSGGAMGAVMVAAALDAKADSSDHPCVTSPVWLWWGETIGNWRDCFEALTSGDFLSADFFGFAFNDMLPFGLWRDRAAVLEDTWSDRYQAVVTRADPPPGPSSCKGLRCPFLALTPRVGHWIPLLVLSGTSETTGSRIVTTALATTYVPQARCPTTESPAGGCQLFVEADRFHDLLKYRGPKISNGWFGGFERLLLNWFEGNGALDDIQLSTAAHNSARFPLISPPGSIRNGNQTIVDRIVDGGYFESYGALGAKELAVAVRAVAPQLVPFVLVISNDPDDPLSVSDDAAPSSDKQQLQQLRAQQVEQTRASVDASEAVTDVVTPLTTIANARTAHGILGVDQLHATLHEAMPECPVLVATVRVWPQILQTSGRSRTVSMSWWLSSPIQRHLHQQTEGTTNQNQNEPRLKTVWQVMNAGCPAVVQ